MAENDVRFGGGLFGGGALPGGTRDDFRARRQREQRDAATARGNQLGALAGGPQAGLRAQSQGMLQNAGARIGQIFQNRNPERFGGPLTNEEDRLFNIQEEGQQRFTDRMDEAADSGKELTAGEQRRLLMTEMAKSALRNGDMQTFQQLSQQAQAQSQQDRLAEAKIAEAEGQAAAVAPGSNARQIKQARELWTNGEREEIRQTRAAYRKQVTSINGIVDIFEDLEGKGIDPNITQRIPGGVTHFVNELGNALHAVGSEAVRIFRPDGSSTGLSTAALDRAMREDSAFAAAVESIVIPQGLSEDANARSKYKAAVIRMAYAAWRQNEGSGSRQASNQDIVMALDSIGANTGDFRTMLNTVVQNSAEGLDALEAQLSDVDRIASVGDLDQNFVDNYFGASVADVRNQYEEVRARADALVSRFDGPQASEAVTDGSEVEMTDAEIDAILGL